MDDESFEAFTPETPLRPLPEDIGEGEVEVIARWAGPRWGALLYVINNGLDEELGEVTVELDATSFRRVPEGWQESSSGGGGGW